MNFDWIYRTFIRPTTRLYGIKVYGKENIPSGGFIVCTNHTSMSDPIIITAAMGRNVCYMAKAELFKIPVFRSIIKAFGAYPVNRGGADVRSLKATVGLIEGGEAVGIFPQGTRMPKVAPDPSQAKSGVGLIAYRSGATVLPVLLKTKKNKTGIFRKTDVYIGKPITNEQLQFEKGTPKEFERASKIIFEKICSLGVDK